MTIHNGSLVRSVALALLAFVGCARRFDLTPGELERIEGAKEDSAVEVAVDAEAAPRLPGPELKLLRVYLKRRLRSYYPQAEVAERFEVETRRITDRAVHRPRVRRISRNVPGKVVLEDTQSGMRRLWISFVASCDEAKCAYGFVETERGRYSLVVIPQLDTFKEPKSYRRARLRRNLLKYARQSSLSEANEVLAAVRRSGKALTIDLQIRKDRRRPTWKDRESLRGVGY